ncbi:hypothetical protein [Levilactobacillus cerevisiae]|uniref:hypothetical protein n=1 Tax=Levilactobacillus cerevisiae TaxID=1704076 RepID=UPI000F7A849F|nr:hypothetical protein [Levilactobacillus cerevisiae]
MYIIGKPMGKRFKRDDIFFVILKLASGKAYTIELSPIKGQNDTFFPRSIKINDDKVLNCTKFTVVFDHQERLRAKKRYTKGIPWPIDD